MKIKTSSTPFVFNRYAVRIPLHRNTPELHLIGTPFVPMATFDRYAVRTPSIYTREVGSMGTRYKGKKMIFQHEIQRVVA